MEKQNKKGLDIHEAEDRGNPEDALPLMLLTSNKVIGHYQLGDAGKLNFRIT